jgi:hypothetical protein
VTRTGVFIEIKTMSITLPSRNDPLVWDQRLNDLIALVDRLNNKAARILNQEGEYCYGEIAETILGNSILVVVCGDLGYFIDALLIGRLSTLREKLYTDKVLFLDMTGIENLIEYSAQNGMRLSEAFMRLINIQNREVSDTNIKDAFSIYDRKLTPWYKSFSGEMKRQEMLPNRQ